MRFILAIALLVLSAAPLAAQTRQIVIPVAPAEITTTVPPSTTGPDSASSRPFPPSPVKPRTSTEQAPAANTTARSSQTSPALPLSITRPDIPAVNPPNPRAICYERQVFNPNTFEYQWQQVCD